MKYKKHLSAAFFLLLSIGLQSQTLRSFERAGDAAFLDHDYGSAMQYYRVVVESDRNRGNALWQYAESARNYFALEESLKAYKKLESSDKGRKYWPLVYYRLGEVEQNLGHYEVAAGYFDKFLKQKGRKSEEYTRKATAALESCRWAAAQSKQGAKTEVKHLDRNINSVYSDFAPVILGDSLYFSSYRFDKKDGNFSREKLTRILLSANGERSREPGHGFPTGADTAHVAHSAFTPGGRFLFFTLCKNINAKDIRCELWLTLLDRRKRWLPPVRLPEPVNLPGYTTTQPSVSYDSDLGGLALWFSSDRPGGKGKMDLWHMPLDTNWFCPCNLPLPGKPIGKLPRFETPVNASELNTEENDITPFYHNPSKTLWFSSEGYPGMGGYDIFSARKIDTAHFTTPLNAGVGINSSLNDTYFFLSQNGRDGYLSSNRVGSMYLDARSKACCNDLYAVRLPAEEPPAAPTGTPALTAVKTPQLDPIPTAVPALKIDRPVHLPAPVRFQDFVGMPLFFDNDEPDKRTRRSNTALTYEKTVQTYLERQSEYRERYSAGIKTDLTDAAINAVDSFFEYEVRRGYDRLDQLCELLLNQLVQGDKIDIHIKGYTSPRAQSDYNLQLSKRRVNSVRNHIAAYAEGMLKPYIQSGQLRITEAGYGETVARKDISDQLSDERNSVYNPDAARERRVEIVAILEHR